MLLLGFIWALAAPLLLVLPAGLLAVVLARSRPNWSRHRRWGLAAALPLAVVLALWLPERLDFASRCEALAQPHIEVRVQADGFLLDDPTANSFGMRYLHEEGFRWIEARSIYQRDAYTRYRKTGTQIDSEEIAAPTAAYSVSSQLETLPGGVSLQHSTVHERASGRLLARASRASFDGGRARAVLGAWGGAQCPDLVSPAGNAAWQAWYHLARNTLQPPGAVTAR